MRLKKLDPEWLVAFFKKHADIAKFHFDRRFGIRRSIAGFANRTGLLSLRPQNGAVPSIPRTIWSYWAGKDSKLVSACWAKIRNLHPGYRVNLLSDDNLGEFLAIDFSTFSELTPQMKSDWIRLELLCKHGGFWLDASVMLFEDLGWVYRLLRETGTRSFGFYRKGTTTRLDFPVIESWFLATPPRTDFFLAWKDELLTAFAMTPKVYIERIRAKHGHSEEYFQKIEWLEYLVVYVAAQVAMRTNPPSIALLDCDQNALKLQVSNHWNSYGVLHDLAVKRKPEQMPKLIKLIGKDRRVVERYYAKGKFLPGSLLAEL